MEEVKHQPVMPKEVLAYLNPQPGEVIVDGTIGLGGHAQLIATRLGPTGVLIGIDQDPAALTIARENLAFFSGKLVLFHDNFENIGSLLLKSFPRASMVCFWIWVFHRSNLTAGKGGSPINRMPLWICG